MIQYNKTKKEKKEIYIYIFLPMRETLGEVLTVYAVQACFEQE
jgi:hypothetical protein